MTSTNQSRTFYLSSWSESRSNRAGRRRWTVEADTLNDAMTLARMAHLSRVNHNASVFVEAIEAPTAADRTRVPLRERRIEIIDGVEYVR